MKTLLILLICALCLPFIAYSAQNARVSAEVSYVYESPEPESATLKRVEKGEILRISDNPTGGWYRAAYMDPDAGVRFGWIRVNDIVTSDQIKELVESAHDPFGETFHTNLVNRYWMISLAYQYSYIQPFGIQKTVDLTKTTDNQSIYRLGVGYFFTDDICIGLQGGAHTVTRRFVFEGETLGYGVRGYLAETFLDISLYRRYPWKIGFSLTGGLSLATTVDILLFESTSYVTAQYKIPIYSGKLSFRYYPSRGTAFTFGGGYQYLYRGDVPIFIHTIDINLSGIFLEGGVLFEF